MAKHPSCPHSKWSDNNQSQPGQKTPAGERKKYAKSQRTEV